MELNNITNTGTWSEQATRLNDNFNKVALGIDTLQEMYESLSQSAIEVVDTLPQTGRANKIYRLVGTTSYSDYMYNADDLNTPILMATYNNAIDNKPTAGSDNLVKSGGVYNELALGAVYDVSAKNPTTGTNNDGKFESLSALLSDVNLNTLIPTSVRKGGMSIKFVQTSDNKYVQYFLTKDEWSSSESDWEKMNLEEEVSQLEKKVSVIDSGVIDLLTPTETRTSGIKIPLEEGDVFLSGDSSDFVDYFPVKKGDSVHLTSQCATGMVNRWIVAGFCNSIPAVGVSIVSKYAIQLANDTIIDKKDFVAANYGYFAIWYRATTMTHIVSVERVSVVKYTEQALTDEQKEQARANINAVGKDEMLPIGKILTQIKGSKISIIGDSISTFDKTGYKIPGWPMYYPTGDVLNVNDTWWKLIIDSLPNASLEVNASYSGSCSSNVSSPNYDFYKRAVADILGEPDTIFVALGSNDSHSSVSIGDFDYDSEIEELSEDTFANSYIKGIKTLMRDYPNSEIICFCFSMDANYSTAISNIAKHYGLTCIDARGYTELSSMHPDRNGMLQISKCITGHVIYEECLKDCASGLGLPKELVNKFIFIGTFTDAISQTVVNTLKALPSRKFDMLVVNTAVSKYCRLLTNANNEMPWSLGVSYDSLVRYDYDSIFVQYQDEYPYYIERVGIAANNVEFSEEEKELLNQYFRLPLFRDNKLRTAGILKENRGLGKTVYNNIVSNSRFLTNGSWVVGPSWTISQGKASCNDNTEPPTQSSLSQSVPFVEGTRYKVVIRIAGYQSGGLELRVDWNLYISTAMNADNLYEFEFTYTSGGHPSHVNEIMLRPTAAGFVGDVRYIDITKLNY